MSHSAASLQLYILAPPSPVPLIPLKLSLIKYLPWIFLDSNLCLRVWFLGNPAYTMCVPKCIFACIHAKNMNVLKIFQISLKIGQYSFKYSLLLGRKSLIVVPLHSHSLRTVLRWPTLSVSSRDMLKCKDSGPTPASLNQNL